MIVRIIETISALILFNGKSTLYPSMYPLIGNLTPDV